MIQELFGGSNVGIIGGEISKLSATPTENHASPSPSVSHSPSSTSAAAVAASENNLRCPRCDSSNTKFCYYNNYNLTQPRHFCKTCRRYWTKGGALRNVPIGGGCRKNKNTTITPAVGKNNAAAKYKTISSVMGKTAVFSSFDHAETLSSNPIIWASNQNSHFLSLIRGNQTPIPNHITNSFTVKDETSPFSSDGSRAFGPDHMGPSHLPSLGIYRNQTLNSHGILHGEVHNNQSLQEVYHRLKTTSNCYPDHSPVILGNMGSANSSTATAILESAPVTAGELGCFWNPTVSWPSDLPTTNGAYP